MHISSVHITRYLYVAVSVAYGVAVAYFRPALLCGVGTTALGLSICAVESSLSSAGLKVFGFACVSL